MAAGGRAPRVAALAMPARAPRAPELRSYVASVWVGETTQVRRERVLPSGEMHLAIRVRGPGLRLYAGDLDRSGLDLSTSIVSGARSRYHVKLAVPALTVGAQLRPGAAAALFGVSAVALAGRHVPLRRLWGDAVDRLQRRLAVEASDEARLDALECALLARLRPIRALHPDVAQALVRLDAATDVGAALADVDFSHRHFVALFRDAAGLAPKRYARLRRFQRVLAALQARRMDWREVALEHGYFDQSHLIRDFHALAGVTPRGYLAARPASPRHLPVACP